MPVCFIDCIMGISPVPWRPRGSPAGQLPNSARRCRFIPPRPAACKNFPCAYFSRYRGTIPLSNPTVFEEWHGGALPQMYANSESSTSCLECSPKIPITHFPSVIKDCMSFSLPLQEDRKRFSQLSPWLYLMSWLSPLPSLCASAPGAAGEPRGESGLRVFGALVALRQSPLYLPAKATRGRLKQRTARVVLQLLPEPT